MKANPRQLYGLAASKRLYNVLLGIIIVLLGIQIYSRLT